MTINQLKRKLKKYGILVDKNDDSEIRVYHKDKKDYLNHTVALIGKNKINDVAFFGHMDSEVTLAILKFSSTPLDKRGIKQKHDKLDKSNFVTFSQLKATVKKMGLNAIFYKMDKSTQIVDGNKLLAAIYSSSSSECMSMSAKLPENCYKTIIKYANTPDKYRQSRKGQNN